MAAMARRCSTFAGCCCLVPTIVNTFLAVYIVKRLARHQPKREENGAWIEEESECTTRVENVQVLIKDRKGGLFALAMQAALLDAGISATCSALHASRCAHQKDKWATF